MSTPVRYVRRGLRIAEHWLDEPFARPEACDLLLLQQYTQAPPRAFTSPFTSIVIDLTQAEDVLLQGLNRDTKYKVRRAESKDQVQCVQEAVADEALCRGFQAFYDEFAAGKGVALVVAEELHARARAGALRFSRAVYRGQTVVWHVHAATSERMTLLHSASHFRQLDDNDTRAAIGRANRLLHWNDMLSFKAAGGKVYDFGGWYAGQEDEALLKINQFKESFGGVRVAQVNAALALSFRGWMFLCTRQMFSPRQRKLVQLQLQAWRRRLRGGAATG